MCIQIGILVDIYVVEVRYIQQCCFTTLCVCVLCVDFFVLVQQNVCLLEFTGKHIRQLIHGGVSDGLSDGLIDLLSHMWWNVLLVLRRQGGSDARRCSTTMYAWRICGWYTHIIFNYNITTTMLFISVINHKTVGQSGREVYTFIRCI